jgi:hypothetical protein
MGRRAFTITSSNVDGRKRKRKFLLSEEFIEVVTVITAVIVFGQVG